MELLVTFSILLLITLIAIPNLPGMRIQVNENAAIQSLRNIYQSEVQYQATYPAVGFACELTALGASPDAPAASPAHARVLQPDVAIGHKSGYSFSINHCAHPEGREQAVGFEAIAIPQSPGHSGHRGFCIDQQGEVKADPTGGTHCTDSLQ